mmetsp:Transcript_31439/g.63862  ORF Transcript_31439/g.63862 Transcript_31439/m.63862 type:complete len:456 (-) Transcript_31439:258-1625(-)|eukprot:CAMPEP_0171968608 /NCGR_PEP_ID=MMETSP0993-20121228/204161_1 /TAXON_ID=483369 /ORGANISM="non described non described, Strain CCMP2098" /LENGTH=455 /DNA_ID=CAMNT_0012618353 /DNA_START=15 /DNA_END=1382 /DNA_ORIENTATION=+
MKPTFRQFVTIVLASYNNVVTFAASSAESPCIAIRSKKDGFGAQYSALISVYAYALLNGLQFCKASWSKMAHNENPVQLLDFVGGSRFVWNPQPNTTLSAIPGTHKLCHCGRKVKGAHQEMKGRYNEVPQAVGNVRRFYADAPKPDLAFYQTGSVATMHAPNSSQLLLARLVFGHTGEAPTNTATSLLPHLSLHPQPKAPLPSPLYRIAIHVRRGDAGGDRRLGDGDAVRCALHALRDEATKCLKPLLGRSSRSSSPPSLTTTPPPPPPPIRSRWSVPTATAAATEAGAEVTAALIVASSAVPEVTAVEHGNAPPFQQEEPLRWEWGCAIHLFSDADDPRELKNVTDAIVSTTAELMRTAAATSSYGATSEHGESRIPAAHYGLVPFVHLKGDLQVAFHHMVSADAFVMSMSSLSWCAAFLSTGRIYAPFRGNRRINVCANPGKQLFTPLVFTND